MTAVDHGFRLTKTIIHDAINWIQIPPYQLCGSHITQCHCGYTAIRSTVEGTIRVLCSYYMCSSFSAFCHSTLRVPSTVLRLAVATAVLQYETYKAGQRNLDVDTRCYLLKICMVLSTEYICWSLMTKFGILYLRVLKQGDGTSCTWCNPIIHVNTNILIFCHWCGTMVMMMLMIDGAIWQRNKTSHDQRLR